MSFDSSAFEAITPQCRGKLSYLSVVESTNDVARKDITLGRASSGSIYIAEYQTSGRGRGGNSWVCPEGKGLLFSIVVEPDVVRAHWYRLSLAVGLAIVESIGSLVLDAEVKMKWPNDIYIKDKKLGGILIENEGDHLIVGVGLNVNVQEFPKLVADRATSIASHLPDNAEINREDLLSKIIHSIYKHGSMIGSGFSHVIEQVMSCFYLLDKKVSMQVKGDLVVGRVLGVSENGYLLLKIEGDTDEVAEIHQAQAIKILKTS